MNILGISCYFHDSAATIIKDGVVVAAAQEERFSRIKHDSDFPHDAIAFCLQEAEITAKELDYVVFYEKPLQKFHRIITTSLATYPFSLRFFVSGMKSFLLSKMWIKNKIVEILKIPSNKILFVPHHISHAASAYFCSPYRSSAIVTIDGVGEWATMTISKGERNSIRVIKEQRFPHSLGLLYSTFTAFLGFEVNEGEYKVMGMASFGKPKYVREIMKLITINGDGSFKLDLSYFSFYKSNKNSFSNKFVKLFGAPRNPNSTFFTKKTSHPSELDSNPEKLNERLTQNQIYADIAASIQKITEDIIILIIKNAKNEVPSDNLCLAGGVLLNSVANGKLLKTNIFNNIYIQPAAGDAGGSLGAALYIEHALGKKKRRFILKHSFFGKAYSNSQIKKILDKKAIPYQFIANRKKLLATVSDAIINRKVVGWMQGRFEWGPRALGARSILADPRDPNMKDTVNMKIKFREPFRPFAASVLEEHENTFFDIPKNPGLPLNFMLYVFPVKKEVRSKIPAVVHVDNTSRPQRVKKDNALYYSLIDEFYKKTGIPMLLNTSFNLRGETIVNSPQDAISTFQRSGIDMLVMENYICEKK